MTPQELSEKAAARLQALGNPVSAQGVKRFFKPHEQIRAYGLTTPQLRKLTTELYHEIKPTWTLSEVSEFCGLELASDFIESKNLGILLLARFRKQFKPALLKLTEKWLKENLCANWAATDALCMYVIAPLLESYPELASSLLKWSRSKNLWVRRASAASLASLARKGQLLELAYQIAKQLFSDREEGNFAYPSFDLRSLVECKPRSLRDSGVYAIPLISRASSS